MDIIVTACNGKYELLKTALMICFFFQNRNLFCFVKDYEVNIYNLKKG